MCAKRTCLLLVVRMSFAELSRATRMFRLFLKLSAFQKTDSRPQTHGLTARGLEERRPFGPENGDEGRLPAIESFLTLRNLLSR